MKKETNKGLRNVYKKHTEAINLILIIILFISVPLFIDHCIIGNKFPSNIENSDWVSFLGNYIGAFSTLIGIWWTIRFTREQAKKDRELAKEQALEERRFQNEPKLLVNLENKIQTCIKENVELHLYYDGDKDNNNIIIFLLLKNIGLGPAINIKITNIKYKDKKLNTIYQFSGLDISKEIIIKMNISMCLEGINEGEKPLKKWEGPFKSRSEISHNKSGNLEFNIEYSDLFGDSYYYRINVKSLISINCWYIEEENKWMFAQTNAYTPQVTSRCKINK